MCRAAAAAAVWAGSRCFINVGHQELSHSRRPFQCAAGLDLARAQAQSSCDRSRAQLPQHGSGQPAALMQVDRSSLAQRLSPLLDPPYAEGPDAEEPFMELLMTITLPCGRQARQGDACRLCLRQANCLCLPGLSQ